MTEEQITKWRRLRQLNNEIAERCQEMNEVAASLKETGFEVGGVVRYVFGMDNMRRMLDGTIQGVAEDARWAL